MYASQCAIALEGSLDPVRFYQTLQQIVDHYEILHTTFYMTSGMELPMQVLSNCGAISYDFLDIEHFDAEKQQSVLATQWRKLQSSPFHLEAGPPLHMVLIRTAAQCHTLLLKLPAICADAFTLKRLTSLLLQSYEVSLTGEALSFDEEELQYIDISSWQEELLLGEDGERQQAFWRGINLTRFTETPLPFLSNEKCRQSKWEESWKQVVQPEQMSVELSAEQQHRLIERCQSSSVQPGTWLLACWQILLWRLTGEDPSIGIICDGRPYEELNMALGPNSRSVPFAPGISLSDSPTFEWVLKQTQQILQKVVDKQLYFTWREQDGGAEDEMASFPVTYAYESWPSSWQEGALQVRPQRVFSWSEPSLVHLQGTQFGEQVQLTVSYQPQVFTPRQAQRLVNALRSLLEQAVEAPHTPIEQLALLTWQEQLEQETRWRGEQRAEAFMPLHQLVEEQARLHPHLPAVRSGSTVLSYQQLDQQSTQLAHLLLQRGLLHGQRVALLLPRDPWALVALLGVLKAGGCYAPLDEDLPDTRLQLLVERLTPALLLTTQAQAQRLAPLAVPSLLLEDLPAQLDGQPTSAPDVTVGPEDLAYVLWTSGSTGTPKGVLIRQQSVSNYTQALRDLLGVQPGWGLATVSSLAADLGNTSIFCGLASGGCVHVLPAALVSDGAAFARYAQQWPLDVLKIVPSHLRALLAAGASQVVPRQRLVLGGEALPWSLVEQVQRLGGNPRLYNHYGPTEATIGILVNDLGPVQQVSIPQERGASVPLGRPVVNTRVSVRDGQGQVVPVGVSGELWLAGMGLAAGYLGAGEQEQGRFVQEEGQQERWYRSGDQVRENEQGELAYEGRQDSQIKLRGYRIELAEIEEQLRQHPEIREAAVALQQGPTGEPWLVGYIVPWKRPGPGQEEVRQRLSAHLPGVQVPSRVVTVEQLPLTSNGKLDRRQLPAVEEEPATTTRSTRQQGARTPIEEVVQGIWQEVLGMAVVGCEEDFFELGGHSLLATRVVARLRGVFEVEVPIGWVFEAPTVRRLSQRIGGALGQEPAGSQPPLEPVSRQQRLPLSFAQQRLWFLDQLEPGNSAYNVARAVRMQGQLDRGAVREALWGVCQRHESLRTTFPLQQGEPVQQIAAQPLSELRVIELDGLSRQQREQQVRALAQQEGEQPFDLAQGPLLRSWLVQVEPQDQVLLLSMHHIISDGWSSGILVRELTSLYESLSSQTEPRLPPLPLQYADYALWQRQWLQGEVLQKQVDYWQTALADLAPLELPTDYARPPMQSSRGAVQRLQIPEKLTQDLRTLSLREGVTLFMTLLAAFQVVLARYSGQDDLAVGTPIANRTRQETEALIGFFVNTLVLRTDLSGDPSFVEVLGRVRRVALEAYSHQALPFEQVVEVVHPQRDLSRSPLFQVFFELQNLPGEPTTRVPIQSEILSVEQSVVKFDLSIVVMEHEQELTLILEYITDLFATPTIERLLEHYCTLLQAVVRSPHQPIARLPLLSLAQRQQLLQLAQGAASQDLPYTHFCHLLAAQVQRHPDRIAASDPQQQVSYAALWQRVLLLAEGLSQQGVRPGDLVALLLDRSVDLLLSVLAIWQVGGAYVPFDPTTPTLRLQHMAQQAPLALLLTTPTLMAQAPVVSCSCRSVQDLLTPTTFPREHAPWPDGHPQQLAYVIFTSGSTGVPKGAMVSQQGMLNHLAAKGAILQLTERDAVAQTASSSFDISVWQLLAALGYGGRVQIFPDAVTHDPVRLLACVREQGTTILEVVPSLLTALVQEPGVQRLAAGGLRWMLVTGEAVSRELCRSWWEQQPEIGLLNAYGPTECSDDVTHAFLQQENSGWRVPIGRPIGNTQVYVLDEQLEPVPQGVVGEVYVGGVAVGLGYVGQAARTGEVFVPDPHGGQVGGRLYRTGDQGRYRQDGQLEYVERRDGQVKLRGYRIEVGEIEEALREQGREAVVVLQEPMGQEARLVGYVKGVGEAAEVRKGLQGRLPEYMIPSQVVWVESFPLTPNGKIDRKALPVPEQNEQEGSGNDLLGPLEELISQVWAQVLHREQVGAQENFFEIGGHSLLATQVIARLRGMLGVEIPLRTLFEVPTISGLAVHLQEQRLQSQGLEVARIVPVPRDQDLPLSFAQQRLWFQHQLSPQSAAYTIPLAARIQGTLNIAALHQSLFMLVQRHESLRTIFIEQEGQAVQRIVKETGIQFPLVDLSELGREEREKEVHRLVQQEGEQAFDLAQGPLLRSWLVQVEPQEQVLLLSMHHIISDGWSMGVLVHELTSLYQAALQRQPSPLAPLPIQYADYAQWQRQWLQGEVLKEQVRYWTNQLSGAQALELPTDFARQEQRSHRGASYHFELDKEVSEGLMRLSRQEGVTLFMLLLAGFQVLLSRYSGQQDIVVGTDSANRSRLETEGLIGFFVNLLALRTRLHENPRFQSVLQQVREMVLGAYAHQEVPFEMIVEHLRLKRQGQGTPLVNVLFVMQNLPETQANFPEVVIRPVDRGSIHAKFDLALFIAEDAEGVSGSVNYSADLFKHETIAILIQRYKALLHSIMEKPDTRIASLEIATNAEMTQKSGQQAALRQNLKMSRGERVNIKDAYPQPEKPA
jgi:amino acid adenylation domain-containing protein